MLEFRKVTYIVSMVLLVFSSTMLIPATVDFYHGNFTSAWVFLRTFFIVGIICVSLLAITYNQHMIELRIQDAFSLTVFIWIGCSLIATFPFYYFIPKCCFIDAFLQSVSTITTTGFDLAFLNARSYLGVNLWRTMLQWIGGIGIIVTTLTIFPFLKIGGLHLYRSEFSDRTEKMLPKISQMASFVLFTYVVLSIIGVIALILAKVSIFDAFYLATSCVSTIGLDSKEQKAFAFLHAPSIKIILSILMLFGGITLSISGKLLKLQLRNFFKDSQTYIYLCIIGGSWILIMMIESLIQSRFLPVGGLVDIFFYVTSFISSTGFSFDSIQLSPSSIFILLFLAFMGGCSGSTSGGVKVYRLAIVYRTITNFLKKNQKPSGFFRPSYNNQHISEQTSIFIFCYVFLYIMVLIFITFGLSFFDLNIKESFVLSIASLSNVGSGLNELMHCPISIEHLNIGAKSLMIFGMLLGRLEITSLLILLMPSFWKK
jgi:trk system potassium uptake protein TrkH